MFSQKGKGENPSRTAILRDRKTTVLNRRLHSKRGLAAGFWACHGLCGSYSNYARPHHYFRMADHSSRIIVSATRGWTATSGCHACVSVQLPTLALSRIIVEMYIALPWMTKPDLFRGGTRRLRRDSYLSHVVQLSVPMRFAQSSPSPRSSAQARKRDVQRFPK